MQADLFVADKGERVFGLVIADFVGDYVGVNYFAYLSSPKRFLFGRAIMRRVEWELLIAGHSKVDLPLRSGNQDVLAFYEHLGYAIGPLLTFYKCLIDEHQDKQ